MELALYCPEYGFYEKEADKVGREGDFFTSVSVGRAFGELLAFQFGEWLQDIRKAGEPKANSPVRLVEAGAYNGQLAKDILGWIQAWRPELYAALEYCICEPSKRLRERQAAALAEYQGKVRWAPALSELPGEVEGVVFSNELLDAMPVRRFAWDKEKSQWFEWGVSLRAGSFVWAKRVDYVPSAEILSPPVELLAVLPDGYIWETSPAAKQWWRSACTRLKRGRIVTFDYGLLEEQLLSPERTGGTLRTYSKHRVGDNLLAHPGEADITAHVNFSDIQSAGEEAGLNTEAFCSQEKFLVSVAEQTWKVPTRFPIWDAKRRRQFQTLVHPQHLGRPFQVLVQSR